jgi:FkbM family methyltransferase
MLELGGFWSYYSLWFLSSHPEQRRAIVVEPDPRHLAVGRSNAALNRREIEFLQASVGAEPLPSKIFTAESVGAIQIPQISVPSFLRERAIPYLDVLHCDTQGAETDIVQSCESLFRKRCVGFGIFSTHGHHITGDPLTHQRCLAMLQDFGGRILAEHDVHESFSGDGLIAAYFGANELAWSEPTISLNRYSTSLFRNPLYDLDEIRIRGRSLARAELPAIEPELVTIDRTNKDRWYRKAQYRIDPNHKLASTIRKLKSGLKKVRQRTSSFRHTWRKTRERSKLAE